VIAFAAITTVWTLGMLVLGVSDALIYLAPALLILLPLLSGRYPGDEVLARAARRARPQRRRLPGAEPRPARSPAAEVLPRGGRLVGTALAGRAPPVPAPSLRLIT
jgi:hypothetical protein